MSLDQITDTQIIDDYYRGTYGTWEVVVYKAGRLTAIIEADGSTTLHLEPNGYINATELCKKSNTVFEAWMKLPASQRLLTDFKARYYDTQPENRRDEPIIIIYNESERIAGHYVHPLILPHVVAWLDSGFALYMSQLVNRVLDMPPAPIHEAEEVATPPSPVVRHGLEVEGA